ncbi:phosphoribosylglycinamide formyltransferase [Eoetvoesiella caeni]|uniref:Phosphoribosylglycinamide formyltransferase n=2 Tax=Eoetvoesiella caeni TaxID=645616 RepID=A0A366HH59_9BURK|nr:phosphoribosylglycinamide formyltransferase [Eoetvoesiella caeni]MCI2808616.1 phosphoribosylglycinamide formyltransferase [Eoetvoesiella caeni]NYT55157.1 phosphoribosylglycinamide formyltransferase [Eoetvoesiella caeni]RBP40862.1 formyltetrahydrofolate-dependent phosphoribosylglycinamide formyltransferase [Eoetvoesiella caeni]
MFVANSAARRFVVLISGRGSNMQAIVRALRAQGASAQMCAVIASSPDAPGLAWAREQGIEATLVPHRDYASREEFDQALAQAIEAYEPHYVLLAGFMRVLTDEFVRRFEGRLINIHPSLLPLFPGLNTHGQALEAGVQWHGCTVHFVTPVLDVGPIIAQGIVPVLAGDTPQTLAERLLHIEHRVYATVAGWLAQGRVTLDDTQRVQVQGVRTRSYLFTPEGAQEEHRL